MTVIANFQETKPRLQSPQVLKDYAGNLFWIVTEYTAESNYNGRAHLWKEDGHGVVTDLGSKDFENGGKGDGIAFCLDGADIVPGGPAHIGDPRAQLQHLPHWVGVAVAYPHTVDPRTGVGGASFNPGSTGDSGMTTADLLAALQSGPVREAFKSILHEVTDPQVATEIGNIRPKVAAELAAEHVLTETDFQDGAHGGSAVVYNQLVNTSFTADRAVEAQEPHEPEK